MTQLQAKTQKALDTVLARWEDYRSALNRLPREDYGSEFDSPLGRLWWDNPNLVWLYATDNDEGYEGSQAQVGIDRAGRLMYEWQSHCSCNWYENSDGEGHELLHAMEKKEYVVSELPVDWEERIRDNVEKLTTMLP